MLRLLKNAEVYTPEYLGVTNVLIGGGKILKVSPRIDITSDWAEITDLKGMILVPGFIDSHVHILGGGGEGGYSTRTPEIMLSDIVSAGVTTVVGCLGTDGVSRNMKSLVAKAKGLKAEGISAYVYSGSYGLPLKTLTGCIQTDIMMVEEIIGVGEIAISDHRSSQPTLDLFLKTIAEARVGGILSQKSGIVNIHLGDGHRMLDYLWQVTKNTEIPYSQLLPTHANRNPDLYRDAVNYAKAGGYIDFTTSSVPLFIEEGEIPADVAYVQAIAQGVNPKNITFSSDGQGSLPSFDDKGNIKGLEVGKVSSLYNSFVSLIKERDLGIETALLPVTCNPATLLKLKNKGQIQDNFDADLIALDKNSLAIKHVYALGREFVKDGNLLIKGTFEV